VKRSNQGTAKDGESRQALQRDHVNVPVRRACHLQTAGPGAEAVGQWAPALPHSTPAAHAPANDTDGSDL